MSITHVTSTDIIGIAKYNKIQSTIAGVLSTYGVNPSSLQISSAGGLIYTSQWYPLYKDINKCITHQTHNNTPNVVIPSNTVVIPAATVNALADAATLAVNNVYDVGTGELQKLDVSSTRTTTWNSERAYLHHTVQYSWNSDTSAGYFFDLGGYITASLSYPSGIYTGQNADWKDLIDTANAALLANPDYRLSRIQPDSNSYTVTNGTRAISISFQKNTGPNYVIDVQLSTGSISPVSIPITATASLYRSKSTSDVWGISAPMPISNNLEVLESGQGPVGLRKTLTISPGSLSYQFYTGDSQSQTNTVSLNNNGTEEIIISSVGFTNIGGVVPIVNGQPLQPDGIIYFADPLQPGESYSFTLAYSSVVGELSNNSFTVNSDADQGNITIPVEIDVIPFLLSPGNYSETSNSSAPITRKFTISRSSPYSGYDAVIVASSGGFSLPGGGGAHGPIVTFNAFGLDSGTYNLELGVYVNGKIRTSTMSVNLTMPLNRHFGSWISARAPNNSVVGVSYDRIAGINYVTLGVGVGGEPINNSTFWGELYNNPDVGIDVNNSDGGTLGLYANPSPKLGPPLYYGGDNGRWTTFMKGPNWGGHGVIFGGSQPTIPVTREYLSRSYTLVFAGGNYDWTFCVDDTGWVEILGIGTITPGGGYSYETNGTTYIPPGTWTINLHVQNTGGPGQIAFQIRKDGTEVWSTLTPCRITFANWMEVYRIPMGINATTYLSRDYIVKDGGGDGGITYGRHFPNSSIFEVTNDGFGNIGIKFNTPTSGASYDGNATTTMNHIPYLPFYYAESFGRYTQNPIAPTPINVTKTYYFLGFNSAGDIRTSVVDFPTGNIFPPPADSGAYSGW